MEKLKNRKDHRSLTSLTEEIYHKNCAIGVPTGVYDKHGNELYSGDKILLSGEECIILWNPYAHPAYWSGMILSSLWYRDKDKYKAMDYGKYDTIKKDKGDRMNIELLERYK